MKTRTVIITIEATTNVSLKTLKDLATWELAIRNRLMGDEQLTVEQVQVNIIKKRKK